MNFAEAIREERGDLTRNEFKTITGNHYETIRSWERGKSVPRYGVINRLAGLFDWDDEKRMALMPEIPEDLHPLSQRLIRKMYYYNISNTEMASCLGVSRSTVDVWTRESITKSNREKVESFLSLNGTDILKLIASASKPKRGKLNIKLVQKIEQKHGGLSECPDDDEDLIALREELRV